MRHVVWFVGSMAVSLALIFLVHHIHEHFVRTLISPIEKNVAEAALSKYKHIYADIYADISNEKSKRDEMAPNKNNGPGRDGGGGGGGNGAGRDDDDSDDDNNGCTLVNLECPDATAATAPVAGGRPDVAALDDMKNELRDFLETNQQLNEPPSKSNSPEYIAKTY